MTFRPGEPGEAYEGIGRGQINLEGMPLFADDRGPFGSLTSDSQRTKITLESARIGFVIIACTGPDGLEGHLARTADLLRRYASATAVETRIQTWATGEPSPGN